MRSRSLVGIALCVFSVSLVSCASEEQASPVVTTPASEISWLPCGAIECGKIEVPIDHTVSSSPSMTLGLYRRVAVDTDDAKTLFLVGDKRWGLRARELVEKAVLNLGVVVNKYNLVAVATRGAIESPLPVSSEIHSSALDTTDDIDMVRRSLGVNKVSVIAWGSGATATAAWVMQRPRDFDAVVLDSPMDPSVSPVQQAQANIDAHLLGVTTAARWCASHLSCNMNANVATGLNLLKTNMRLQRVPSTVTQELIGRAAENSLATGITGSFFQALSDVMEDNPDKLLSLGGLAPDVKDAYSRCADVSVEQASKIATMYSAMTNPYFGFGSEAMLYGMCATLPPSDRPVGVVKPSSIAREAKVMVTIARGDPVVAPYNVRTMAKGLNWTYKSVYAHRHLVVGFDQAITASAMAFLAD